MKIAVTQQELDKMLQKVNLSTKTPQQKKDETKVIEAYYTSIGNSPSVESLTQGGYRTWFVHTGSPIDDDYKNKSFKKRHEAFVAGILYCHEQQANGKQEMTAYIDWGKINTDAYLTIYLHNTQPKISSIAAPPNGSAVADEALPDPPPPPNKD